MFECLRQSLQTCFPRVLAGKGWAFLEVQAPSPVFDGPVVLLAKRSEYPMPRRAIAQAAAECPVIA